MKYLIFLVLLISTPLDLFASPHKCYRDNNKEFLHTKDGCIRMNYIPEMKDSIIEKETASLQWVATIVSELNSLAASIEAKPKSQPNKQIIDDISTSLIKYINIQLDFRKSIEDKIGNSNRNKNTHGKKMGRKHRSGRHRAGMGRVRDSIGLSIYTSTFVLYNIFQQPDTYHIHKREITSNIQKSLEKLNRKLISELKNYTDAYYNSPNYKKETDQYMAAVQQSLLFLSKTYASKILELDKSALDTVVAKRKVIINTILDDATVNVENLKAFLELEDNRSNR